MITKISEVKQILDESTYNLLDLCTSDKINMWSTYKPVHFNNKATALTTSDFKKIDYGYSGFVFNSPLDLIHNLTTGWKYTKPISYFRLGDFREYNHNLEKWYLGEAIQNYDNVDVLLNMDLSIFLNFNSILRYSDLDFGFLINTNLDNSTSSCYYYRVNNVLDIDEKYNFNTELLQKGQYKVIPVLTTELKPTGLHYLNKQSTFNGSWFMFPTDPISINVSHILQVDYINLTTDLASWNVINESILNLKFDLCVMINSGYTGSSLNYSIDLIFKNAYIGNVVKDVTIASVSGTISNGETKVHNIEYNDSIGYLAGDYDSHIPLTANINAAGKTKQMVLRLEQ